MTDTKLSWTELRRALAARAGVSDKEANTFLNAFNDQLVAALKSDKQVRVNGLGTFKLQAVAPRKSVNVKTGEEIIIDGYNKIAFVPEAGVKELVESSKVESLNRTEPVESSPEPIDPLKKLGAQAEEIVDILGELGQEVKASTKDKVQSTKDDVRSTMYDVQSTKDDVRSTKEEPVLVAEPEPIVAPEPEPVDEPEKPKKRYHFMRDTLICVVILLMVLMVGYFFLRNQLSGWINELVKPKDEVQSTMYDVQSTKDEVQSTKDDVRSTMYDVQSTKEEWSFDEILLTEEIAEGSRLAWIAKKHYGNKAYWPYIYAANKDRITNPSVIPVGTPIRVPKLTAAMRDTTDVRFQQLKEEAIEAIR